MAAATYTAYSNDKADATSSSLPTIAITSRLPHRYPRLKYCHGERWAAVTLRVKTSGGAKSLPLHTSENREARDRGTALAEGNTLRFSGAVGNDERMVAD